MVSFSTVEEWLHPYAVPFFKLQYPTDTPTVTDSFHDSAYYNTGKLDFCLVITCIAVMAFFRDAFRLGVFEPFARWKLSKDLECKRLQANAIKANGNGHSTNGNAHAANGHDTNGNGHAVKAPNGDVNGSSLRKGPTPRELRILHRSVLRFAEQGWSVIYYTLQLSYGLVCQLFFSLIHYLSCHRSISIDIYQRAYSTLWICGKDILIFSFLALSSCTTSHKLLSTYTRY